MEIKLILNRIILIAVILVGFLGFPSTAKAENNMAARSAGIMAGVAVGIGIIIGAFTRSKNTNTLQSAPKEETSAAYFPQEQPDYQKTPAPLQQLEFHIAILDLRF